MPEKTDRKMIVKCEKCKNDIELIQFNAFYVAADMSMVGRRAYGIPKNSDVAVPFDEFIIDKDKSKIYGICAKCKKKEK